MRAYPARLATPSCTRAPPESLMKTNGEPVFSEDVMVSAILPACTSPAEPPATVKSWLATCTSRPSIRPLAVGRKNFYGSGSEWSGALACACFTLLATLRQHRLCPRKYFQAYLEACARAGGRAPANLEEFLPWKWSAEKRAAYQAKGRPP